MAWVSPTAFGFRSTFQRVVVTRRTCSHYYPTLTTAGTSVAARRGILTAATTTTRRRPLLCGDHQTSKTNNPITVKKRAFSGTRAWRLHTKEMDEEQLSSLKVDQKRLVEDLHYTCQWGTGERWGEYVVHLFTTPTVK